MRILTEKEDCFCLVMNDVLLSKMSMEKLKTVICDNYM